MHPFDHETTGVDYFEQGSKQYAASTSPVNSSVDQEPRVVVRPASAQEAVEAVPAARRAGLVVAVQATGHGAARQLGNETLLIDTRRLNDVQIDAASKRARVGVGATWGAVQKAAEAEGLLALAGTSPDVGVSGYTFGGGVGWLTRPHGLASATLRSVEFVDGSGALHHASEDSEPEALWAFRGGQPVGLATSLEIDLVPRGDLVAGFLLWTADRLDVVAAAWSTILPSLPASVTSTLALLQLPPDAPFPAPLPGNPVVHLSFASVGGAEDAAVLLDTVRAAAAPAVDTAGPADAERLATIHLDPPPGSPSRGMGRWLSDGAAQHVVPLFEAARVGTDDGLQMIEVRHVESTAVGPDGALTTVPAPFLLQAIGSAASEDDTAATLAALDRVRSALGPVDAGLEYASFRDGESEAGEAFTAAAAARLARIAEDFDPDRLFRFERAAPRIGQPSTANGGTTS